MTQGIYGTMLWIWGCLSFVVIPVAAANTLINGDFDAGPGLPWVELDGGTGFPLIVDESTSLIPPQSGAFLAWLGGISDGGLCLYQDVVIPAETDRLELSGYRRIVTDELGPSAWDFITIEIRSTQGTSLETLAMWSNLDATTEWYSFTLVAAGDYAGETIRLWFCSQNDATADTHFFFDTLVLNASAPSGVEGPTDGGIPWVGLRGNFPNPFNPRTTITFGILKPSPIRLVILSIDGSRVRTLAAGDVLSAGMHEMSWNGRDDSGCLVASGTYFYRLEAGDFAETKRMTLLK